MSEAYWRWPESSWLREGRDWRDASGVAAGIDVGTTSTQAAIFCDGELHGYANIHTGPDFRAAAERAMALAAGGSGLKTENMQRIAATGFGARNAVCATKFLDEVQCHGRGARFMYGPEATTVADLGGQTTKCVRLYDWDRVRDFVMSDKCATGMGRSVEMMADMLQVPITEMGARSLDVEKDPEPVSTTCYSFANPETIGLLRTGFKEAPYSGNEVLAAYLFAVAWRILGSIGKLYDLDAGDVKVHGSLAFTGGLAKNAGITRRLERALGTTALSSVHDPQLAGAIGAALLA
ncbi:MAG: acyl-CoA dehydratase activase [Clostridiales Family XIII bacterium]|jgi:benzoyl-CoA reductase subunit A|nr:acyl-CoA dehydratase activase [Clostridiales Family XIII bacterium]